MVDAHLPEGPPTGSIEHLGRGNWQYAKRQIKGMSHVGMLAGGTGITPMYQIVQEALRDTSDKTKFSLIFANQTLEDILLPGAERPRAAAPRPLHGALHAGPARARVGRKYRFHHGRDDLGPPAAARGLDAHRHVRPAAHDQVRVQAEPRRPATTRSGSSRLGRLLPVLGKESRLVEPDGRVDGAASSRVDGVAGRHPCQQDRRRRGAGTQSPRPTELSRLRVAPPERSGAALCGYGRKELRTGKFDLPSVAYAKKTALKRVAAVSVFASCFTALVIQLL